MAITERKAIAIAKADELLSELRIREPDEIDIERIALFKGVDVTYAHLDGMDGCLVSAGDSAIITVRDSISYEGQKRFVIGHELGHFFLHPRTRQVETVDKEQTANWSEKQQQEEYEANIFSAELLMPARMLQARTVDQEPSFEMIRALADLFRTTLTATAAQFVLTTTEECALISSANRKRLWFLLSPGFSFWLHDDERIHGHSCAAEVNESNRTSRCSEIGADFWLKGFEGDHKSYITEDAIYFPTLRRSLSLLWIHEAI
jgi:IrrE N-terminal-like domain